MVNIFTQYEIKKAEEEENYKKLKERVEAKNAASQPVTETRAVTESILTHDQLKDSTTRTIIGRYNNRKINAIYSRLTHVFTIC